MSQLRTRALPRPGAIAVRRVDLSDVRPSSVRRVARPPRPGSIAVPVVAAVPQAGSLPSTEVVTRRAPGSIAVERVKNTLPAPRSQEVQPSDEGLSDTRLGRITIDDRVVVKIARRAAADHPDAGAVATQVLGAAVPGLSKIGGRSTSLDSLPKATATVDGTKVFIDLEISIRYPAPVVDTTEAVRAAVRDEVHALTGLDVSEVNISVGALVTDLPTRPRVR